MIFILPYFTVNNVKPLTSTSIGCASSCLTRKHFIKHIQEYHLRVHWMDFMITSTQHLRREPLLKFCIRWLYISCWSSSKAWQCVTLWVWSSDGVLRPNFPHLHWHWFNRALACINIDSFSLCACNLFDLAIFDFLILRFIKLIFFDISSHLRLVKIHL